MPPLLIVLGGGGMETGQILRESVQRLARYHAFGAASDRTRFVRSTLTEESGVPGAAAPFLYEEKGGRLG